VLSHLYTYLGRNKKLGLTGRKSRDVGILSTSKLYSLKDRIFAFTPQVNIKLSLIRFLLLSPIKSLRDENFINSESFSTNIKESFANEVTFCREEVFFLQKGSDGSKKIERLP